MDVQLVLVTRTAIAEIEKAIAKEDLLVTSVLSVTVTLKVESIH